MVGTSCSRDPGSSLRNNIYFASLGAGKILTDRTSRVAPGSVSAQRQHPLCSTSYSLHAQSPCHARRHSSSPHPSLSSASESLLSVPSSTMPHITFTITALLFSTPTMVFHSLSALSRSSVVTFLALPFRRLSSLVSISAFSYSSEEMDESMSAALSELVRDASVARSVLARAWRSVVCVVSVAMRVSYSASWSGETASSGLWVEVLVAE